MKAYFLLTLPLVLVACSHGPDKATFATSIQSALSADNNGQICRDAPPPIQTADDTIDNAFISPAGQRETDILAKNGYVTVTKGASSETIKPTAKYFKVFGPITKDSRRLCYGKWEFKEVTDFTSPSEGNDGKSFLVNYTLRAVLDANNPLSSEPDVLNQYHMQPAGEVSRKARVVQKDSGWVVEQLDVSDQSQ